MAKTQTFLSKQSEDNIQKECIAWFRNQYERKGLGCIIPVVNEATYNNKNFVIKEGCSDLIVVMKRVFFVEMKTAKGKQRDAQIDFERLIDGLGFDYYVCRNLDQFKEIIYENV